MSMLGINCCCLLGPLVNLVPPVQSLLNIEFMHLLAVNSLGVSSLFPLSIK